MSPPDDPLWTLVAFAIIFLAGVWAYNRRNEARGARGAPQTAEPKQDGPRPDDIQSAPNKDEAADRGHDSYNTERAIRNWTAVLAISGVFAAIFAAFTLSAIRGQLTEMHEAGVDTRKLAEATMRLANHDRAWLFVIYRSIEASSGSGDAQNRNMIFNVRFTLKNEGSSPAIIKALEPKMFIAAGNVIREPDPREANNFSAFEGTAGIVVREDGGGWLPFVARDRPPGAPGFGENQVVIPSGQELRVFSSFFFGPMTIDDDDWGVLRNNNGFRWFFCAVAYQDVNGITGETGLYAKLGLGSSTEAPNREHRDKYNYWK